MFFRLIGYSIVRNLREKEIFFWNLCFPIILGTLFFVTFGNYLEKAESFHAVSVAYVQAEQAAESFETVLEELEHDSDLLAVTRTDMDEAEKLLENGDVYGIYYYHQGEIRLCVKEEGIEPSILKIVLDEYEKMQHVIEKIMESHPEKLQEVVDGMAEETQMLTEETYTEGKMDSMITYFYALIAMTCLYGCFTGVNCAVDIKANMSPLGARRLVASTNRFLMMAADIAASIVLQFVSTAIAIVYLKYVLGVDFGRRMPYVALVVLVGAFIGIATGFFIGSVGKQTRESKIGIAVAVTMFECFLSGLMVGNMYYVIQGICPLLNKINPAALIVDALYSLDIYTTYERFYGNLGILLGLAVLLSVLGFLTIRRERYASI